MMRAERSVIAAMGLAAAGAADAGMQVFTPVAGPTLSGAPVEFLASDLNFAGKHDLAALHAGGASVSILLSDGASLNIAQTIGISPIAPAIDVFKTGCAGLDTLLLLPPGPGSDPMRSLVGDASGFFVTDEGIFEAVSDAFTGQGASDAFMTDFDNDDEPSIVSLDFATGEILSRTASGGDGCGGYPGVDDVYPGGFGAGGFVLGTSAADLATASPAVIVVHVYEESLGVLAGEIAHIPYLADNPDNNGSPGGIILDGPGATFIPLEAEPVDFVVFNADGAPDDAYAVINASPALLQIRGAGDTDIPLSSPPTCIAAGDIDGDGDQDLAVGVDATSTRAPGDGEILIFANDGSGGFMFAQSLPLDAPPVDVAIADLLGDGRADLAALLESGAVALFRNDGPDLTPGGPLTLRGLPAAYLDGAPRQLIAGDFDNVGKADMAALHAGGDKVSILLTGATRAVLSQTIDLSIPAASIDGFKAACATIDTMIALTPGNAGVGMSSLLGDDFGVFVTDEGRIDGLSADETGLNAVTSDMADFDGDAQPSLIALQFGTGEILSRTASGGDGCGGYPGTDDEFGGFGNGGALVGIRAGDLSTAAPNATVVHAFEVSPGVLASEVVRVPYLYDNLPPVNGGSTGGVVWDAQTIITPLAGDDPVAFVLLNADADAEDEVAVVDGAAQTLTVLWSSGGATNTALAGEPTSVATGDIDGDSDADIVVGVRTLTVSERGAIQIFENIGGLFVARQSIATSTPVVDLRAADLAGDSAIDIGALLESGAVMVLTNFGPASGCFADLSADGQVNGADLGLLLSDWGDSVGAADLNQDGKVDGADFGLLLSAWGACP